MTAERYFQLKQQQKEIETELEALRQRLLQHCGDEGVTDTELGRYRVRIVTQERREYDDRKLYEALRDPEAWRLVSRADPGKIASLVKLNVIAEDRLRETYAINKISALQVELIR